MFGVNYNTLAGGVTFTQVSNAYNTSVAIQILSTSTMAPPLSFFVVLQDCFDAQFNPLPVAPFALLF